MGHAALQRDGLELPQTRRLPGRAGVAPLPVGDHLRGALQRRDLGDARYNAALGLARQGNLRAMGAVAEMLDPEALSMNIASENTPALQAFKRDTIIKNALDAIELLVEKNPGADLGELDRALEALVTSGSSWQPKPVPQSLLKRAQKLCDSMSNVPAS